MTRNAPAATAGRRDPVARREAIVAAAAELFAQDGYASTSTSRIARAAGLAEGTLFHHFPNKRALLTAVAQREGERVLAIAVEGLDPRSPPPDLAPVLARLFAYGRENPGAYRVFLMDDEIEALADGFSAKRTQIVGGLAALLAAWSARGFVRRLDPEVTAELVFALVDTAVRRMLVEDRWGEEALWTAQLLRAIDALLAPVGTAAEPGGSRS